MREILFRGKRVDNGEWVEGSLLLYGEDAHIFNSFDFPDGPVWAKVDPTTVGQYTGLKANGKRIFEGDIIKGHNKYIYEVRFGQHWDDEYESESYGWFVTTGEDTLSLEENWSGHEVIGNIHDNPELLGGNNG